MLLYHEIVLKRERKLKYTSLGIMFTLLAFLSFLGIFLSTLKFEYSNINEGIASLFITEIFLFSALGCSITSLILLSYFLVPEQSIKVYENGISIPWKTIKQLLLMKLEVFIPHSDIEVIDFPPSVPFIIISKTNGEIVRLQKQKDIKSILQFKRHIKGKVDISNSKRIQDVHSSKSFKKSGALLYEEIIKTFSPIKRLKSGGVALISGNFSLFCLYLFIISLFRFKPVLSEGPSMTTFIIVYCMFLFGGCASGLISLIFLSNCLSPKRSVKVFENGISIPWKTIRQLLSMKMDVFIPFSDIKVIDFPLSVPYIIISKTNGEIIQIQKRNEIKNLLQFKRHIKGKVEIKENENYLYLSQDD